MTGQRRGAYVELGVSHGDMQPMFWWLAQRAGVDLDFFAVRSHATQRAFAGVRGRVAVTYLGDSADADGATLGRRWVADLQDGTYDFIVLGSAEPAFVSSLRALPVRKLLVVHRPDGVPAPALDETWCMLTEHGRGVVGADSTVRFLPYFAGDVILADKPAAKIFCVPGTVQLHRRNYGALVRTLRELRSEGVGPDDLRIRLVGRWSDSLVPSFLPIRLDGERLRHRLEVDHLADMVEFPASDYDYPQFYEALRSSRYVVPLIDDFYAGSRPYLEWKCSGAACEGLAWLNIPVINDTLAGKLGIEFGYRYRRDDVASGIRAALTAGDDSDELRRLELYRTERLERGARAFLTWLHE